MDRGAWRATGFGVTESDMTEQLTHTGDIQVAQGNDPICRYRRHKRPGFYKLCLLHKVSRVLDVNSKCAQGILPSDFKKRRTFA